MREQFSLGALMQKHSTPEVPPHLLRYTCGTDNFEEFIRSGAEVFTMLDLASQKYSGKHVSDHNSILDFGCGNGRLLRFIDDESKPIYACDVNRSVVEYVHRYFPYASVYCNALMPPLIYRNEQFDLIYSFSVFSHLSLEAENEWLKELGRIGSSGCLYLLSIHGEWFIDCTLKERAKEVRAAGFWWNKVHHRHGSSDDFPEYYEASYHTSAYIEREWSKHFEILSVIKGDDPFRYVSDRNNPEQGHAAGQLRPMGQDLVVARKR
jgi:SAM-dependent methyltransferase